MVYDNENTHELTDKKIVTALKEAVILFENGAIIETHDILVDIITSLNAFIKYWED